MVVCAKAGFLAETSRVRAPVCSSGGDSGYFAGRTQSFGSEEQINKGLPAVCLTVWVVLLTHGLGSTLAVAVLLTVVLLLAQVLLGRACRDVTRHSGPACSG